MVIRESFGNKIVCHHFYGISELELGSRWQSSSGSIVIIDEVKNGLVTFRSKTNPDEVFEKDSFSFQTRYCKIVG